MLSKFLRDRRGDYAIMTTIMVVPILGALALAIDYGEMNRQRNATMNALDAAGIATARRIVEGATDAQAKAYAQDFFYANLNPTVSAATTFNSELPSSDKGGGLLTLTAQHKYKPYFLGAFLDLINADAIDTKFVAETKVRLKNTLEVALVLDNSGSMDYYGSGSGKKRIDVLKVAAKQLVATLAGQASQIKQVTNPVQFGLVPFAASVNVGADKKTATWMDLDGKSPIHHENFDWTTMNAANNKKRVDLVNGIYYKKGSDWGSQENQKVTRLTLYDDLKRETGGWVCKGWNYYGCYDWQWQVTGSVSAASWQGCVETRPYPYNTTDDAPSAATPATLFVPMFAPDEADGSSAENSWWNDDSSSSSAATRQKHMPKYFKANNVTLGASAGPNASCTTKAITPLTDVTNATGLATINNAIDAMSPLGATNVPQGLAWGWRVVSGRAPYSEGRPDTEKGNDKVVIVLTDGANTYYTPSSLGYSDAASNKSIYSAFGYAGKNQPGESKSRLFMGTDVTTSYSNDTYTLAMNGQMKATCDNAKADGIMVMTVSLDLSSSNTNEKKAIDALQECASESRFRRDSSGNGVKLYWNATGGNLEEKFKEIADELSNLRIVG